MLGGPAEDCAARGEQGRVQGLKREGGKAGGGKGDRASRGRGGRV